DRVLLITPPMLNAVPAGSNRPARRRFGFSLECGEASPLSDFPLGFSGAAREGRFGAGPAPGPASARPVRSVAVRPPFPPSLPFVAPDLFLHFPQLLLEFAPLLLDLLDVLLDLLEQLLGLPGEGDVLPGQFLGLARQPDDVVQHLEDPFDLARRGRLDQVVVE